MPKEPGTIGRICHGPPPDRAHESMIDYVSRQPILAPDGAVYGYQLQSSSEEQDCDTEGTQPSTFARVSDNRAETERVTELVRVLASGQRVFLGLGQDTALKDWVRRLPRSRTVYGVSVISNLTDSSANVYLDLVERGFELCLKDLHPRRRSPLDNSATYVELDFLQTSAAMRRAIAQRFEDTRTCFLAKNLTSRKDVDEARSLGVSIFHGSYFWQPETQEPRCMSVSDEESLSFLRELQAAGSDFALLHSALSDRNALDELAAYLRSGMGRPSKARIDSLSKALEEHGTDSVQRAASLIALSDLATDKPRELVRSALFRAHFAEGLADGGELAGRSPEAFEMGFLSTLDALVDRPMADILSKLAVSDPVVDALIGRPSPLNPVLYLILCYEQANWTAVSDFARGISVPGERVAELYAESLEWASCAYPT